MVSIIEDKYGKILEIQEDGETVWTREDSVHRDKISDESRQTQKDAIANNNIEKRIENLEEILFGKEIHNG